MSTRPASVERGTVGDRLVVDRDYFYRAVGDRKRLSGAIKGSIERKHGGKNDTEQITTRSVRPLR
jgi:hypothetical protein